MRQLVAAGANPNVRAWFDDDSCSVLHMAAASGMSAVTAYLCSLPFVDVNQTSDAGVHAWTAARSHGHSAIADAIAAAAADASRPEVPPQVSRRCVCVCVCAVHVSVQL
jgi:hypothetical protein